MNERIRELAEQARKYYLTLPTGYKPEHVGMYKELMEKFAELIIKEAISVVKRRYMGDNNREDMEVRRCVEDLKKHFGVE